MLFHCSGPRALSVDGSIYCLSASEVVEFTVSALQAAASSSVPLKEGMRPVPIVEEAEVAEAGKDEKQEGKHEETPGDGSAEQPVYVTVLFVFVKREH